MWHCVNKEKTFFFGEKIVHPREALDSTTATPVNIFFSYEKKSRDFFQLRKNGRAKWGPLFYIEKIEAQREKKTLYLNTLGNFRKSRMNFWKWMMFWKLYKIWSTEGIISFFKLSLNFPKQLVWKLFECNFWTSGLKFFSWENIWILNGWILTMTIIYNIFKKKKNQNFFQKTGTYQPYFFCMHLQNVYIFDQRSI